MASERLSAPVNKVVAPVIEQAEAATHIPGRQGAHLPALDALRGLAILLVMLYHFNHGHAAATDGSTLGALSKVLRLGGSGVDLFFVLSGFLITSISDLDPTGWVRVVLQRDPYQAVPTPPNAVATTTVPASNYVTQPAYVDAQPAYGYTQGAMMPAGYVAQ